MCADELFPELTLLLQTSLDQVEIPEDCRPTHISPIYKKGDKTLREN